MIRITWLFAVALAAYGQSGISRSFRWVQEVGGSDGQTVAGIRSDAQGNTYIAGTAASVTLATRNAVQSHPNSSGLFRIDGPGNAWRNLYNSGASAVFSLAASRQNPNIVYAVSAQGLIRSSDGGDSWTAPLPGLPDALQAIAVDPANEQILYAGTVSAGVFKSTNAGASWVAIDQGLLPAINGELYVWQIWADPLRPVIFAALDTGLARSTDGGATWVYATQYPHPADPLYVFDLSFDPLTPGVLYIASTSGALRSSDEGQTWTSLTPIPGIYIPQAILADPVRENTVYAGAYPGIFVSTDSGGTWTRRDSQPVSVLGTNAATGAIYAVIDGDRIVTTTDAFATITPVGPPAISAVTGILAAGSGVLVGTQGAADVFVMKLDSQGNVVYSTYFGGSGADAATGLAIDAGGSVYVTGSTSSLDFPVTANAYAKAPQGQQSTAGAGFLFKLNPDGSLAYSTYFANLSSIPKALAVDASGHAYVAGISHGDLPVTAGAYQAGFRGVYSLGGIAPPIPPPTNAFLTKFNADGSALQFSTYIGNQQEFANAIVLDPAGNAYLAGGNILYRMSADGKALLSSTSLPGTVNALALDKSGSLYVAGAANQLLPYQPYPTTAGAFQRVPLSVNLLPGDLGISYGTGDAFVTKLDGSLRSILVSTLLGGEGPDIGAALAIAANGDIVVGGYTQSQAFPLLDPVQQAFSSQTGFIAQFPPDLSHLISSTTAGDTRSFLVTALAADPDGSISFAGSLAQMPSQSFFANLVPGSRGLPRIDSVVNAASHLPVPLSPGETIQVRGDGFTASSTVFLGDREIPSTLVDAHSVTAIVPAGFATDGATGVRVVANGVSSNSVLVPIAATSPGIFTADGSGSGQGYILNADGTRNSPSNAAAPGSAVTIFSTGAGQISFSGPYAVTATPVSVFIAGLYANGIAATFGPASGLPGNVYKISVYVPKQSLAGQVAVNLQVNGVLSQPSIALSVGQ